MKHISLVSGVIFAVIGILHLLRLVYQWPAQIADFTVPMWASGVAIIAAGLLSLGNFMACHKGH